MVAAAAAISAFAFGWRYFSGEPKPVNPAVLQAFRHWEAYCLQERWPNQTVRCQALLDRMSCQTAEFGCTAREWYDFLDGLGFDLPPHRP